MSRDSSVGIATRLQAGRSGDRGSIPGGSWEFFSSPPRRERLEPTQHSIHWVPGIKQPGREADHSPPSSAEVKNSLSYNSTPNTPSWRVAQLKRRDKFTFTLPYRAENGYFSYIDLQMHVVKYVHMYTRDKVTLATLLLQDGEVKILNRNRP
jgi:hypothetical protein